MITRCFKVLFYSSVAADSRKAEKKILYLGVSVYSAEHEFGTLSGSIWNLEVLVFEERGKPEYLVPGEKKNSRERNTTPFNFENVA